MNNNEKYFDIADYKTITAHSGDSVGFYNQKMSEDELYANIIDKYRKELNQAKGILINLTTDIKINIDKLSELIKQIINDDCEIIISMNEKKDTINNILIVSLLISGLEEI